MNYTIEKDIPFNGVTQGRGKWAKLLKKMKIGDSIKVKDRKEANSFYTAARTLGIQLGSRKNGTGVRVWKLGKLTKAGNDK